MKASNHSKPTNNLSRLGLVACALTFAALSACTKETPYQSIYKQDVLSKANVDTKSEFLYVSSYATVSRSAQDAIPFYMGDEQIVKFNFSANALDVVRVETDERFSKNSQNNKTLLSVPIEHKAYRCEKDRFGECRNKEEENRDISDNTKDLFKPDFTKMSEFGASMLPADIQKYFNGCYEQKSQREVGYEFTTDAVNIEVEKTYELKADCASLDADDLADGTIISIVYHHSFLKINKFASPDYKAQLYPDKDQDTFGFFKTTRNKLDVDNRDVEKTQRVYMNRWNPNRQEVVYTLSDEFDKPENAAFKKASHVTFDKLNDGLAKAGAKFRMVLKDPSAKKPGDIRNSMIVLVEDPSGAGLLGYGPAATNPYTGEILSARVVMFSGILKTGLRRTYEEIREKRRMAKQDAQAPVEAPPEVKPQVATAPEAITSLTKQFQAKAKIAASAKPLGTSVASLSKNKLAEVKASLTKSRERSMDARRPLTGDEKVDDSIRAYRDRLDAMSKRCLYPIEFMNVDANVMSGIETFFADEMPAWDDLSDEARAKFIDALAPTIFEQILLHEMGHNLGLRHNFKGSEDKANWYKDGEIPGLTRPIPYSSVMDYSASQTNELPVLGKYDIAAFRFAYAGQVEVAKAGSTDANPSYELVKVDSTIEKLVKDKPDQALRDYGYCTDEGTGANPGCKRFDEGTSLTEIASHWIRTYDLLYKMRNFRNGMRNFSTSNDPGYIKARYSSFLDLRMIYEGYERLKNEQGWDDSNELWTKEPFLADLKKAALITGQFFLRIMKTPDVSCVAIDTRVKDAPPQILLIPVKAIGARLMNCDASQIKFKEGITLVGEAGRAFQSMKSPTSTNPYVDQVDVRGIWMDKLLAGNMLLKRELNNDIFDKYTQSYIDMPELRPQIQQALAQILLDNVTAPVVVTGLDGKQSVVRASYSLASTHTIPDPLSSSARRMLGLPGTETMYIDQMMEDLKRNVPSRIHESSAREFLTPFTIYTASKFYSLPEAFTKQGFASEDVGDIRYVAGPENGFAYLVVNLRKGTRLLNGVTPEGRALILQMINEKATIFPEGVPPEAIPQLKEALKLDPAIVQMLLSPRLQTVEYYDHLLSILPKSNVQ